MSRFSYFKRIFAAYLTGKQSHLTFWHGEPRVNENFEAGILGEYYMPFIAKANYAGQYDQKGIPMLDYHGSVGLQYNPIAIAHWRRVTGCWASSRSGFDASAEEIFPALTSGAALVVHPSPSSVSGTEMLRFCSEQEISVLHLPAAYWHQLVADASSAHLVVPGSIRLLVVGGESPSVEKLALWQEMSHHGVRVINSYGPTEVTVTATGCDVPATTRPAGRMIPIGRPIANVAVFVLDSRLVPVPAGVPGVHVNNFLFIIVL